MFQDPGTMFQDPGTLFQDPGTMFQDPGTMVQIWELLCQRFEKVGPNFGYSINLTAQPRGPPPCIFFLMGKVFSNVRAGAHRDAIYSTC